MGDPGDPTPDPQGLQTFAEEVNGQGIQRRDHDPLTNVMLPGAANPDGTDRAVDGCQVCHPWHHP